MNSSIIKLYFTLVLLLCFHGLKAQETEISISFDDFDFNSIISLIEDNTDFHFFFQDSWVTDFKKTSKKYDSVAIQVLLSDLLKDTILNYYILDNKVFLTPNVIIYDTLPDNFFGKKQEGDITTTAAEKSQTASPIFRESNNSAKNKMETIVIGKATKNNSKQNFTLSGYVRNRKTANPIANVIIVVNGENRGVETDANGFYSLIMPRGSYVIEINSLGIEKIKKRVLLYNDGRLDLSLNDSIEFLDEIVLTSEVNNVKEVVTKTTVNVEESKNIPLALGERDVLKVSTSLPGISTAGEGASGYNVRGGKSDQNLILLDNAVIYNPQHFFGIFSALNPFAIGTVDIYKNGIPAEYGGRLSSVFDLKTKNASNDKFKVEGSVGPVTGNVLLETPIVKDKSGLLIGGRGAYANWLLNSLDEESLNDSEASFFDVVAKYNHIINDKSTIEATAYWSRDDFSITSDSLFIYGNRALSLGYSYRFNEKNSGKLSLSNSQYNFDIEFDEGSSNDFDLGFEVNETELKLHLKNDYNKKLKFGYGLSSKLYAVNPGSIDPIGSESIVTPFEIEKERGLESAVFLTTQFDVTDRFGLEGGIRYSIFNALGAGTQNVFQEGVPREEGAIIEILSFDTNEFIKTYGGFEPRISGRYLFNDSFSIKGAYNKTFQYIHILSNNTTVSPIDVWKLSDLNIEPQSSQQYSLGLYKNLNEGTYELSLEGFYKRSKNILDFKTGAEILLNENIETEVLQGRGKSYGVELLIKKQKGKLYGWLGYTYSRSFIELDSPFDQDRVNNGDFFPSNFDKPHDFSLVANYKFTKRFSLATNFVYQTGRPVTFPIGNFVINGSEFTVFSDRNNFRIPDFYRLDLGFNIEGNHKKKKLAHSFVTISIYNVLGRNNPFSVFFVTEDGEVKGLQSSIFSVPIPSITYNFKF